MDTEVSVFDVRITNNGIKSFVFEQWPKGLAQIKQKTIGRCGEWNVEQATDAARKLAVEFSDSNYPQKQSDTKVRKSFSDALKQYAETKLLTIAESAQNKNLGLFHREILPLAGNFPIKSFKRKDLSGITFSMQQRVHQGTT